MLASGRIAMRCPHANNFEYVDREYAWAYPSMSPLPKKCPFPGAFRLPSKGAPSQIGNPVQSFNYCDRLGRRFRFDYIYTQLCFTTKCGSKKYTKTELNRIQQFTVFAVRSLHIHNTLHSRLLQAWNLASNFITRLYLLVLLCFCVFVFLPFLGE